ncbi:MAG TPA: hypothetical protein VEM15_08570 [Thermodesulfobacteriota bacterium]|nr:hypothetical protein [Thermodesulfobacteriota bacterium]
MRLQIGIAKKKIESGILLLTSLRSEKSFYKSSRIMVEEYIQNFYPTISLPVSIALFYLGRPVILQEDGNPE